MKVINHIKDLLLTQGNLEYEANIKVPGDKLSQHYDPTQPYFTPLSEYMVGQELKAFILEDKFQRNFGDFIDGIRNLAGKRSPITSRQGQIRHLALEHNLAFLRVQPTAEGNQYCYDNLVHTSDSAESAIREINIWFSDSTEVLSRYSYYYDFLTKEI